MQVPNYAITWTHPPTHEARDGDARLGAFGVQGPSGPSGRGVWLHKRESQIAHHFGIKWWYDYTGEGCMKR